MKIIRVAVLVALFAFVSCNDGKTTKLITPSDYAKAQRDILESTYPESITKVLNAHGSLEVWKEMETLKFTMRKETGNEITTTDLKNRYSIIEMPNHTIGYDGTNAWLQSKGDIPYDGNPKFYYNLMFYFYAMPFVVADDGIIYEEVDPLVFEGKKYPGIKVSFESGVGESSQDEYIVYYDSQTGMMTWLGYTVTYFTKEKSKTWSFIKYDEWQAVNGIKLPKQLVWYNVKDNMPTSKRNVIDFVDIILTESSKGKNAFKMPTGAKVFK